MTAAGNEEQVAAWEDYRAARQKADRTLDINDGIASVRAYKKFYDLFVEVAWASPLDPPPSNAVTFPIHKTRPPGGQTTR